MINTKPNTSLKYMFLLSVLACFYNCNSPKESYTFEKQRFEIGSQFNCEDVHCASLEINLIQSIEDNQISTRLNTEIEKAACAILNIEDQDPEATMEEAIREFNLSYQEMALQFSDETVPYEATIDCELSFRNQSIISISMQSYIYTGGAHGYGGTSYVNINAKTGTCFQNEMLFKNPKAFLGYVEKVFRKQHNIAENASINSTGFFFENDTFSLPETIGFTDNEVILYYNSYEISSFAEGGTELKLNKKDVASFFSIQI